jgi:AcrR family transcriptional regulator
MPNRAPAELDWNAPAPDRGRGLTRDAVVAAAVAIADRDGLSAVSIRRVAGELAIRPMSIYTHVASKDDLVDLMVNEVVREVLLPEPLPQDWREAVSAIAHRSYDAFLAHPWTLQAVGQRPQFGPNTLRHVEQSLAAVAGLGLEPQTASIILGVVDAYTLGQAMRVALIPDEDGLRRTLEETLCTADPDAFPHLAQATAGAVLGPHEGAFEVGLDALLDGFEQTLVPRAG